MNNNQEQKGNFFNEFKGRGLFYAVIAIATFIIMAVGATFAYFTASTNSANTSVQTGSTTLQLQYIRKSPKISCLLNLFEEHLDYFGNKDIMSASLLDKNSISLYNL